MGEFDLSTSFIPSLHKPSALLPIARHRQSLLYLVETFPVTIVIGQTGSGKTTQIPQFLQQAGWCNHRKVVAVTQVGELDQRIFLVNERTVLICISHGGWPLQPLQQGWQKKWAVRSGTRLGTQYDSKI